MARQKTFKKCSMLILWTYCDPARRTRNQITPVILTYNEENNIADAR
jgi:hypothetical protein